MFRHRRNSSPLRNLDEKTGQERANGKTSGRGLTFVTWVVAAYPKGSAK
jgi:hypothetical protein